jgi:16S rRNA (guanine1207-N2)-methyltransferase
MSHYFDEVPGAASAEAVVSVDLPDTSFTLRTDRGVFSHGRLDAGTAILLRRAPSPPARGALLDLGCGAGPIALTMARRAPAATVWAVDVNARARALCAANAAANRVGNVVVRAPEEVPADVRFDAIWSNPPIRIGKDALHELLASWLDRLTGDGRALLVVQKNLGSDSLQRWLTEQGWPTARLASARGYRLLDVRPRGGDSQVTSDR